VAIWIYTLVFAFASLWFAHYALDCLQALRDAEPPANLPHADLAPLALPSVTDHRALNNSAPPRPVDPPKPT
jgi:hypothetical protein